MDEGARSRMIATDSPIAVREARRGRKNAWKASCYLLCLLAYGWVGCSTSQHPREEAAEPELHLPNEVRVAVAPALNHSGSAEFDPVKVGDLMASELSGLEGVKVVGVSRVLAVLAEQGNVRILSPEHALDVCEKLGVDGILVFAVTEYDAYSPVVGLAAQMYGPWRPEGPLAGLDPVAASRAARPFPVAQAYGGIRPQAQVQRTFNASHEAVQRDVQRYAHSRSANMGPLGWKRYLASQEDYLRYCCFTVGRDLMSQRMENQAAASVAVAGETGR
jgi:hypothetical protein